MTEKEKKILNLINQLLEQAKEDDLLHQRAAIAAHKASGAVGESWFVFHLKVLKELVESPEENQ